MGKSKKKDKKNSQSSPLEGQDGKSHAGQSVQQNNASKKPKKQVQIQENLKDRAEETLGKLPPLKHAQSSPDKVATPADVLASKNEQYKEYALRAHRRRYDTVCQTLEYKLQSHQHKFESELKGLAQEYYEEMRGHLNKVVNEFEAPKATESTGIYKGFSEKRFSYRESLLSIMFERDENIKTLYNIAVAGLMVMFMNLILYEYKNTGTMLDLDTLASIFNKPDVVFNVWIRLALANFLIIPFTRWVHIYRPPGFIWKTLYLTFQTAFYTYSCKVSLYHKFGFASAMIVMCECARMSMKMHSYFRNKLLYGSDIWQEFRDYVPTALVKRGLKPEDLYYPSMKFHKVSKEFKKYLYFFFAPTLLYRDKYIKAPRARLGVMIFHLVNFLMCIYYAYVLFKIFIYPVFVDTGSNPPDWQGFLASIFSAVMPGVMLLFLTFFCVLHSWFNAFAEILRFPDRYFYEDWWNSLEFGTYYRKWNIVVHEWLYYFVYWDLLRFTKEKVSRGFTQVFTFVLSAVIHEVLISVATGFFYPILFVIFVGPGMILIRGTQRVKNKYLNIVFWILMFIGTALLNVLYCREYYARKDGKVDPEEWGYWYYLAPRSLLLSLKKYWH